MVLCVLFVNFVQGKAKLFRILPKNFPRIPKMTKELMRSAKDFRRIFEGHRIKSREIGPIRIWTHSNSAILKDSPLLRIRPHFPWIALLFNNPSCISFDQAIFVNKITGIHIKVRCMIRAINVN